jgi:hypothetical protein
MIAKHLRVQVSAWMIRFPCTSASVTHARQVPPGPHLAYSPPHELGVLLQRLPPGTHSVDEIPTDFRPEPLGPRDEVTARLLTSTPEIDFSDPAWGVLDGDGFSIELNVGADPVVDAVMLHVRGGGDALGAIRAIAEALGVPALDCSTSEIIDFASPEADRGWRAWQAYRDKIVSGK